MGRLSVRVHPRAARNLMKRNPDGTIEVWTTSPAVDGQANRATCGAVAQALGLPHSAVSIWSGATSRHKVLDTTLDPPELERRLAAFFISVDPVK